MSERATPAELARLIARMERTKLEDLLAAQMLAYGLPVPVREARFHPKRKWRFDFAWPDHALAVEVEGGVYSGGRHVRPGGFERDTEKYNAAVSCGWRVLRFTGEAVRSGKAVKEISAALG
jgi:very-short-patch-repair endonuclease